MPLLNGVEHVALLRERYPQAKVVASTIRVESTRIAPAHVRHDSPFASIELAVGNNQVTSVQELAGEFERVGLDVQVTKDENAALWGKLSFLAPMALLTTDQAAPVGVVRDLRRGDLSAVVDEVAAVARSEGAPVAEQGVLEFLDRVPAGLQSSMQRDAAAGRPIELEAIGGAVVRAAARHSIPVPMTAHLVRRLRERHPT